LFGPGGGGREVAPGDWVCYGCLDWGPRLFHPDDAGLKDRMLAAGCVCEVIGEDGEFWVLRFGSLRVRLRKELVGGAVVPRPAFDRGDRVQVRPPRTERVGVVRAVGWHDGQQRHLFWIAEAGRQVKSRYLAEELERVQAEPSAAADRGGM
jgi:hypothetical protein